MVKTKTAKQKKQVTPVAIGDQEVTVCRRRGDRRDATVKRSPSTKGKPAAKLALNELEIEPQDLTGSGLAPSERRKVPRRRQIDPTTCERDYTNDEIEFMHALDAYKRSSGRMFPTCSEILEVVRGLGYQRLLCGGDDCGVPVTVAEDSVMIAEPPSAETAG